MKIVLVTGMSGSGKSVVLNVLEDAGFFCIDNLPVAFLDKAIETLEDQYQNQLAVAVDVRTAGSLEHLSQSIDRIRAKGRDVKVLFLNARDDVLIQRYSETRRRHPLSRRLNASVNATASAEASGPETQTLAECIAHERELLSDVESIGIPIDTSDLQPQVLRRWVRDLLGLEDAPMTLLFQSFAFKDGIPLDADLVFDARCLPNPYYEPALKPLTGCDDAVVKFLKQHPQVEEMLKDIAHYLKKWLPRHAEENRSYLTVAIGCTGGQHRSVYMAEELRNRFKGDFSCAVRHRALSQKGKA